MNDKLQAIINQKPYLAWDIKDVSGLSENSMVEHIINYGNWDDVLATLTILGIEKTANIFDESINKPRNNYRPQTINFFKLYFQKYAQGNSQSATN
jgi:hypothetical protein